MVWALAQAVCGSLGPEGAATDLSALRVGLIGPGDRKSVQPVACARRPIDCTTSSPLRSGTPCL
jgi:hypothetical protein